MDKDVNKVDTGRSFGERSSLKAHTQRKEYLSALEGITRMMRKRNNTHELLADSDPLFAACVLAGNAAGIRFRKPYGDLLGSHEDPLQLICRFSGIRARMVTLRMRDMWWNQDNGPMLCFSSKEHKPLALLPGGRSGYRLIDPSSSDTVELSPAVADGIAEQAWMFYSPFPEKPLQGQEILKFGMFGCREDVIRLILLGIAASLFGLLTPVLTGILFGTVIPQSNRGQLLQLALILMASVISVAGFDLAKQIAAMRMQNRIDMRIQSGLIDRLLNLPSNFFRNYSSGDLAVRVMGATQIREILSSSAVSVLLGMMFSLLSVALLFYYSWKLALVALFMTVIMVGLTILISFRQLKLNRDALTVQGKISGMLGNWLGGIAKIRVTGTEKTAFSKWAALFINERGLMFDAGKLQNTLSVVTTSFPVVAMAVIFFSQSTLCRAINSAQTHLLRNSLQPHLLRLPLLILLFRLHSCRWS